MTSDWRNNDKRRALVTKLMNVWLTIQRLRVRARAGARQSPTLTPLSKIVIKFVNIVGWPGAYV